MHPCTFLVCCPDFCIYVHTHIRTHERMHACMNMRACTHACMYEWGWTSRHMQTLTFLSCAGALAVLGDIKKATDTKVFSNHLDAISCKQRCTVYDVTHAYLSPYKNEIYWLTHTYTHTHRYAGYQGRSRTHSSYLLSTRHKWENWIGLLDTSQRD